MARSIWTCLLWSPVLCSGFAAREPLKASSSTKLFSSAGRSECLVVLSADTVFDTVTHRSKLGLEAALCAWPALETEKGVLLQDPTWLFNKMKALAHVLDAPSPSHSNTCEFALAARLLLEEQALDEGESNNKRGKYASRFHPQGVEEPAHSKPASSSTRPLTVGEIAANWETSIRETLQVRYHADYKDPMPVLQSIIDEKVPEVKSLPTLYPHFRPTLTSNQYRNFVVTVPPSDKQLVQQSLEDANIPYGEASSPSEATQTFSLESDRPAVVVLESEDSCIEEMLESYGGETMVVVEDSYKRLEHMVPLFGDSIPRQGNVGNTPFETKLSLNLGKWACGNPTTVAKATMNPWTDVITVESMQELFGPQHEDAFQ